MLKSTKGIILQKIKYSDSGIIVQAYTRDSGRVALMARGMRNKKSGKHNVLFQPMFILEMVYYYRESREIQMLKEFSSSYTPYSIYSDVKKSCIAVFLSEILGSVLREETANPELFEYLEDSIILLDKLDSGYSNFHIAFLAGLCRYLGFEPAGSYNPANKFFDLLNGSFVPLPPVHSSYANERVSGILLSFFKEPFKDMNKILLNGPSRDEALDTIIRYFTIHLPGLKKINSLEVMKEIFN